MSTDQTVTDQLVQTLEDGREGFALGAEKLEENGEAELAATFRTHADERAAFSQELQQMAAGYGDDVDDSGTVTGTLHRAWLSVKDAVSPSDAAAVLGAAEQGEDHAKEAYDEALGADLSPELRQVVERQARAVHAAHDQVRAARDARS